MSADGAFSVIISNPNGNSRLNVVESTVKIQVQNILKKLTRTSRVQIAVYAVEHGLEKE